MKKLAKKEQSVPNPTTENSSYMKALEQSLVFNNFHTHYQFSKDLGMELLKGSSSDENIKVLKISIEGLKEFIQLLEEKIKERKNV